MLHWRRCEQLSITAQSEAVPGESGADREFWSFLGVYMESLVMRGRVWIYGDNLDSERMAPTHIFAHGPVEDKDLAKSAWIGIDPGFPAKVCQGDIIVAGANCGYGSSRGGYHVRALKAAGVGAIVAESLSPLFLRSCINDGLPAWSCKGITEAVDEGDEIELDLESGSVFNITRGNSIKAALLSETNLAILIAGGLIPYVKQRIKEERQRSGEGSARGLEQA